MGDKSGIEWTEATWNPVVGCSKVSPGCAHCYAETLHANRMSGKFGYPTFRPWTPENAEHNVTLLPDRLDQPLRWTKPRMVFVNSMSDVFHELIPDTYISAIFDTMERAPQHTFQVLTKRPERMRDFVLRYQGTGRQQQARLSFDVTWPLPNVWLGTSIENRRYVGRADALRATPAAVRFISAEPLLGPLVPDDWVGYKGDWLRPRVRVWRDDYTGPGIDLTGIDWLIVGGESGPDHRPIKEEWVRDLLDAARATDTAYFFKQWGGPTPKSRGRLLGGRTYDEMPTPR